MPRKTLIILGLACLLPGYGCEKHATTTGPDTAAIAQRMQKYAVKQLDYDASSLPDPEKKLLKVLVEVAQLADEIYMLQTSPYPAAVERIRASRQANDPARRFLELQAGPYDRLDNDAPFLNIGARPAAAGFYPSDLTQNEFETWLAAHPADRKRFLSPYTLIRRKGPGLIAVPYAEAYRQQLVPMINKLRFAATLTQEPALKSYLTNVAQAIIANDYSELAAWNGNGSPGINFCIGPYFTGEDKFLGLKASFAAHIDFVDSAATARFSQLMALLPELDADLPYPASYKQAKKQAAAKYEIVTDIYRGGYCRVDYRHTAMNLPIEARICGEPDIRNAIRRNVLLAQFEDIVLPVAGKLLLESQTRLVTAEGFYRQVLLHEVARALGPEAVFSREPGIATALGENFDWVEHVKADAAALYSLQFLQRSGQLTKKAAKENAASWAGFLLHALRSGVSSPRGKAAAVTLNYLRELGGLRIDTGSHRVAIDFDRLPLSAALLANEVLTAEAEGDAARIEKLAARYGIIPAELAAVLKKTAALPLVVAPLYSVTWN